METLTLNGTGVGNIFEVKISRKETVAALKKAIKNEDPAGLRDVDADTLHLCQPRNPLPSPFEENLSKIVLSEHAEDLMMALDELSEVFPEPPPKRHIHIIIGSTLDARFYVSVRADATMSELKHRVTETHPNLGNVIAEHIRLYRISGDENELRKSLSKTGGGKPLQGATLLPNFLGMPVLDPFYVVAEDTSSTQQDDTLTVLTESFKRAIAITSNSLTPFQAVKSSDNPANTVAPPIQLFNPAFAYFSSNAFNLDYDVPDDYVRDLVVQFALIHPNEDARRHRLRSLLQQAIRHPLMSIHNPDKTAPDVVGLSSCGALQVYLIVSEVRNEFGNGGSDPSVQAALSFRSILSQKENSKLRLRCCCPAFIIAHAGPWLTIMGGIFTSSCIVQRLTDFLWIPVHSTHDDGQCRRIARVLYALRESIRRLNSWYQTIADVTPFNPSAPAIHPRFFPSPNIYWYGGVPVKFVYQKPLEQNISCVTYLARTIEDNSQDIVVKFVTSYGVDAHRKMALAGFAPQVLYYGPINGTPDMPSYGELCMVVMEYVQGLTFEDALEQRNILQIFKDDLRRAFQQLHSAGYVFGDLRKPNVIVTPERPSTVQLIVGWHSFARNTTLRC